MREFNLANGVLVHLRPVPGATSVSIAIGIKSGSRDDNLFSGNPRVFLSGIHHYAEHVTTRATKQHPSWRDLCRAADSFSANYNAFTDQLSIVNMMTTDRPHVREAIRFLARIVREPLLTKEHVEFERERIRQECRVWYDEPSERVQLDFDRLMFPDSGLAHPILGTEQSIQLITVDHLRNFWRRLFVGKRLVVVVVGNFDPDLIEPVIRREFESIRAGTPPKPHNLRFDRLRGGFHLTQDDTLQIHTVLGWPTPGMNDPRRVVLYLIRNEMSARTSSRLKLELDSVGHGYSHASTLWNWDDVGQYNLEIPVSPDHYRKMLEIVGQEIRRLREGLIPRADLELAKDNLSIVSKDYFDNHWESTLSIARALIIAGHFIPLRTYVQQIRRVTRRQILEVANDILHPKRLLVVSRGPITGLRHSDLEPLIR